MKLLQGHIDLMKAGFGFPCTLKEDTVPHLCAHLSEVCLGLETSVPTANSGSCQTAEYISCSMTKVRDISSQCSSSQLYHTSKNALVSCHSCNIQDWNILRRLMAAYYKNSVRCQQLSI